MVRFVQIKTQTNLYIQPSKQLVGLQKERQDNHIHESKTTDDLMNEKVYFDGNNHMVRSVQVQTSTFNQAANLFSLQK